MQADDQIAEWLVRWEDAQAANQPAPALDQLPAELRPRAREGLRLLHSFAWMANALSTTVPTAPESAPQPPPNTPRYRFEEFSWPEAAWPRCGAAVTPCWRAKWRRRGGLASGPRPLPDRTSPTPRTLSGRVEAAPPERGEDRSHITVGSNYG